MGNAEAIAAKHYLQVTEDHYQQAAQGDAKSDATLTQKATQQGTASNGNKVQETTQAPDKPGLVQSVAVGCVSVHNRKMTPRRFELRLRD
jgi:hypothetical protein